MNTVGMVVRTLCSCAADFLAPRHCVFCGIACMDGERHICRGCLGDLPWREPRFEPQPGVFAQQAAILNYEYPVSVAIKALKFRRKSFYAPAFAELLGLALPEFADDIDSIVPVPLHWLRCARRGFNQAEIIASPLARSLRVSMLASVVRVRNTPYQSGLEAAERARNIAGAFAVRGGLNSRHALIVDDVVTTGVTATQLAAALRRSGVARVSLLTLAKKT